MNLVASTERPPVSAAVLPLHLSALACFRLMHCECWDADPASMCADADHAHHCLASADTGSDERLRRAALSLLDA